MGERDKMSLLKPSLERPIKPALMNSKNIHQSSEASGGSANYQAHPLNADVLKSISDKLTDLKSSQLEVITRLERLEKHFSNEMFSVKEVAKKLGKSERFVRKQCDYGLLGYKLIGLRRRITAAHLQKYHQDMERGTLI